MKEGGGESPLGSQPAGLLRQRVTLHAKGKIFRFLSFRVEAHTGDASERDQTADRGKVCIAVTGRLNLVAATMQTKSSKTREGAGSGGTRRKETPGNDSLLDSFLSVYMQWAIYGSVSGWRDSLHHQMRDFPKP